MHIIKAICLLLAAAFSFVSVYAEDGHQLWLRSKKALPVTVVVAKKSPALNIAVSELQQGWQGKPGATITLVIKKEKDIQGDGFRLSENTIQAATDLGILYGVYALLRRQQTHETFTTEIENPSYGVRILDHWDNPDGSVERGYAGNSIFWRKDSAFTVTSQDRERWQAYARANASVGINGTVLNNVNASPLILTPDYIARAKAIADVLRTYGVKVYLSVKFSSPSMLGKLKTSDPLDTGVIVWWRERIKEIYTQIPDFGGFLIKASSEGQPGPQDYGRSHADGANMLADLLKPFNGIVMWRAFVYSPNDKDRAKQAFNEFVPLDGQFRDNVIIQVKNGPIDFQPREPFSPLFGALKKTAVMPEFQITQEYLGHAIHLVFLSTMWEECLQSDTYQFGPGSTVARCTDGTAKIQKYTAIAGVANIGLDTNWCGHDFAQANWYAFGRLAWNNKLKSDQIASEWLQLTFGGAGNANNSDAYASQQRDSVFLLPVKNMMMESREAAVNYMTPLGLHHIMSANEHYGPGPWWAPPRMRADWTPPYYHKANADGIGFDRTKGGSDAVSQYQEPLASTYNNANTCPDECLLWFHHLPWDFKMKSGHTLWDELCYHYDKGVRQVREFQKVWDRAAPFIDSARFMAVQSKLRDEAVNAQTWKDACLLYFQQFSKMPIPYDLERPVNNLDELIRNDSRRKTSPQSPK